MGEQIKIVGKNTNDENFKTRCSPDLLQAVAENMKYHISCLVKANGFKVIKEKQEQKLASS